MVHNVDGGQKVGHYGGMSRHAEVLPSEGALQRPHRRWRGEVSLCRGMLH
jgi:hypothetical protein